MDAEQFREASHAAIEQIIDYFKTIEDRPVVPDLQPGYLRHLLPDSAPEKPESWGQIQPDIAEKIMPGLTHWQHPNFMAFFPATVSYPSILGEMYSAAFTAPGFNWLCSPAATELETVVMDWLSKALGLPDCFRSLMDDGKPGAGGGVIHGSASEAVLTTIIAARERHVRKQAKSEGLAEDSEEWEDRAMELRSRLVALASDQAHSCTAKGARIAGVRFRTVPTSYDENLEMTGEAVRQALLRCEAAGLKPFFLTCSVGTTNTVAVDRLAEIKKVLQEKEEWKDIWIHIDAAYAGAAMVCEEYHHISKELANGVDSFDMNTHKWLLINFDASCLYVRNHRDLTTALDMTPPYLKNPEPLTGIVTDYRNWQIPLGRRFRALKIWFVMRNYGLSGLKTHIRRTIKLGEGFAELVAKRPDLFSFPTKPAFGVTVLRINGDTCIKNLGPYIASSSRNYKVSPSREEMASDAVTLKVAELINEDGEIYITHSVAGERTILRVVSTNERADEAHVRRAFDILVKHTEEILSRKVPLKAEVALH
ncbi:DNA replication protein psf1 [Ascosphaera pollenicola]|nr:DNA replication protein psf1 [Ascosphaera pollenicola]